MLFQKAPDGGVRVPEREDTGKSVAPRALQGRSLCFVLVRSAGYDDDGDGDAAQPRNGRLRAALQKNSGASRPARTPRRAWHNFAQLRRRSQASPSYDVIARRHRSAFENTLPSVRGVISRVLFSSPVHVRSRLKWEAQNSPRYSRQRIVITRRAHILHNRKTWVGRRSM